MRLIWLTRSLSVYDGLLGEWVSDRGFGDVQACVCCSDSDGNAMLDWHMKGLGKYMPDNISSAYWVLHIFVWELINHTLMPCFSRIGVWMCGLNFKCWSIVTPSSFAVSVGTINSPSIYMLSRSLLLSWSENFIYWVLLALRRRFLPSLHSTALSAECCIPLSGIEIRRFFLLVWCRVHRFSTDLDHLLFPVALR